MEHKAEQRHRAVLALLYMVLMYVSVGWASTLFLVMSLLCWVSLFIAETLHITISKRDS